MDPRAQLLPVQRARLDQWFPDHQVVADHAWPGQDSIVLELVTADGDLIIAKASIGPTFDHHLSRELRAHRLLGTQWGTGFPRLLCADDDARLLVTRRLPGELCEGTDCATDPAIHRAAGSLLAELQQAAPPRWSESWGRGTLNSVVLLLERARALISTDERAAVVARLDGLEPAGAWLVATHGDFQPRNWLVDTEHRGPDGVPSVALIDFGRFDLRPWYSDLIRLHHQDFAEHPDLRAALLDGAGRSLDGCIDDSERSGWHLEHLQQSLGTIVWATDMGLQEFARHGHSMLDRTLSEWTVR